MYHVTAHYDVIYYTLQKRKRHFENIVDSYKIINDVIIWIGIIHVPVIFLKDKFELFSFEIRYKWRLPIEKRQSYWIFNWYHIKKAKLLNL